MKVNQISHQHNTTVNNSFGAKASVLTKEEQILLRNYKYKHIDRKVNPFLLFIKRCVDVTHGFAGLIISAPILLLSAAAIKADSKGPVLFKQERLGKDGVPFTIYKLRTMHKEKTDKDFDIANGEDSHITRVGKFLRKYSIDEFPQFLNIIKGDMSLIGPRPITERTHNTRKNNHEYYYARYAVKPGASLPYKNTKCDNDKDSILTEKNYVENLSLKKDFSIFLGIFSKVLGGKNY